MNGKSNRLTKLSGLTRSVIRKQQGFSLVEVIIGIVLLSIISVAAFESISTAVNGGTVSNKRTTAVSLANTIMENAKGPANTYQFGMDTSGNPLPLVDYTSSLSTVLSSLPAGYQVNTLDNQGNMVANAIYGVPWDIKETPAQYYNQPQINQSNTFDSGIQKITVIIVFNGKEVFRLADFKVNR